MKPRHRRGWCDVCRQDIKSIQRHYRRRHPGLEPPPPPPGAETVPIRDETVHIPPLPPPLPTVSSSATPPLSTPPSDDPRRASPKPRLETPPAATADQVVTTTTSWTPPQWWSSAVVIVNDDDWDKEPVCSVSLPPEEADADAPLTVIDASPVIVRDASPARVETTVRAAPLEICGARTPAVRASRTLFGASTLLVTNKEVTPAELTAHPSGASTQDLRFGLRRRPGQPNRLCDCASCIAHRQGLVDTSPQTAITSTRSPPALKFVRLPIDVERSTADARWHLHCAAKGRRDQAGVVCGCIRCGLHRNLAKAWSQAIADTFPHRPESCRADRGTTQDQ